MAESELRQCLDEVVEFIRALPVDCHDCGDLAECQEAVSRSVREAAPPFIQRWPMLLRLLAATSTGQVIDFLVDLAVRSKCPMQYLSPGEKDLLSGAGLSSREQLLLGKLRERLKNNAGLS